MIYVGILLMDDFLNVDGFCCAARFSLMRRMYLQSCD